MANLTHLQKQVKEYDRRYGWSEDEAGDIVLHMSEELGEVSRNMLRYSRYKKEAFDEEKLAEEIIDLLYLTLKLANKFDIDLDEQWNSTWDRYEKKTSRR